MSLKLAGSGFELWGVGDIGLVFSTYLRTAEGMYFSFPDTAERTFVMRGLLFSLDFVWVRDGRVVKLEEAVPAPAAGETPKFVYSKPEKANGVFEFPAGFVPKNGVRVGDNVTVR